MKSPSPLFLSAALVMAANGTAAETKIGDFRLDAKAFEGKATHFDPGFSQTTRPVSGAPVQITSTFSGTSQQAGDRDPDADTDIGLQTYWVSTVIRQLNRYQVAADGKDRDKNKVGAVQWAFDLEPLEAYLKSKDLRLEELDLDLKFVPDEIVHNAFPYDVYLSYDRASMVKLRGIDKDPGDNFKDLWAPAQKATVGDIVAKRFEVLQRADKPTDLSYSLAKLYRSGVRKFHLIIASGGFAHKKSLAIGDGSGLSITTSAR